MSTIRLATDWNLPIGLPNCLRDARVRDAGLELPAHHAEAARENAAALPFHRALEHLDAAALAPEPVARRERGSRRR